jgi:hypothetical protein
MRRLLFLVVPLSLLWATGEDTIPVTHWVGPDSLHPGTYQD